MQAWTVSPCTRCAWKILRYSKRFASETLAPIATPYTVQFAEFAPWLSLSREGKHYTSCLHLSVSYIQRMSMSYIPVFVAFHFMLTNSTNPKSLRILGGNFSKFQNDALLSLSMWVSEFDYMFVAIQEARVAIPKMVFSKLDMLRKSRCYVNGRVL